MLLYCTGKGPRAILVRIEKFLELSARSRENPYIKQRGGEQHMGHVLKLFKRTDIPFVKGSTRPMIREPKDAKFIHQNEMHTGGEIKYI